MRWCYTIVHCIYEIREISTQTRETVAKTTRNLKLALNQNTTRVPWLLIPSERYTLARSFSVCPLGRDSKKGLAYENSLV